MPRTPAILSRSNINYRATYTSGMAALDAMRQVERESRLRMLQKDLDIARKREGFGELQPQLLWILLLLILLAFRRN